MKSVFDQNLVAFSHKTINKNIFRTKKKKWMTEIISENHKQIL